MLFWPLNPIWTQIRTLRPQLPEVQPSFNYHCLLLGTSKTNVFLTFEPDLYSNSDSLTSITQGPTKSQPSLVTISEFLNRCSFDPDANRQTNKQTNEFFSYDPPYSRGNYNMCVAMRYEMRVIRWTFSLVFEFDAPHVWNFLIFLY